MSAVVIGTAGHIDHGKSTLVRALTGHDTDRSERTKPRLDRLKEEQARGITIDLGFDHLTIGGVQLAFVDVPGHERFVRNMLAGAGGIDAVLLVVAATESVKPQTREHFAICRLLGIDRGVIALTKIDAADADAVAASAADARALVAGSFLEGAPLIPVSARSGEGLETLRTALAALAGRTPRRHRAGVVRVPVDRVFTVKGFGAVATGTLVSGAIAVGDELTALPDSQVVRVRGLHVHGHAVTNVAAPARVAVNLAGVDAASLRRGVTLATAGSLAVTRQANVQVHLLVDAPPLAHGARVRVHHGTAEEFARLSLAAIRPRAGAAWEFARAGNASVTLPPGGEALARLRFERPAVLTRGDRRVLRTASPAATIGGAVVLDPEPRAGGVRKPAPIEQMKRLAGNTGNDGNDALRVAGVFLAEADGRGLNAEDLVRRGGLDPTGARAVLESHVMKHGAFAVSGRVFSKPAVDALRGRIESDLERFHREQPTEPGIPRETLRGRLRTRAAGELVDALLADLGAQRVIRGTDRLSLATHQPELSDADARARALVDARLRAAGLAPQEPAVLSAELHVPGPAVERAIHALVKDGRLLRLDGIAFHREALAVLKADVVGLRAGAGTAGRVTVDVAAFKTRYGLSRKHAIPLLEWLDRERVTRRVGDVRIVL